MKMSKILDEAIKYFKNTSKEQVNKDFDEIERQTKGVVSIPIDQFLANIADSNEQIEKNKKLYAFIEKELIGIISLKDNWDGYNGVSPNKNVIHNTRMFLSIVPTRALETLYYDGITPTPHGTIVLDFENHRGLVSIEIGDTEIGFFTRFKSGVDSSSDGVDFKDQRNLMAIIRLLNRL